jgi:muramoyltetrapeptide carboxypeptidase
MKKPMVLKKGGTIGVIAPSGIVKQEELASGIKRLEELGFRVVTGQHVRKAYRYMAGSDQERADDLHEMFSKPEVNAILCARGGYGSTRLLPLLDEALIRNHPKILIGSSDVTALLVYLVQRVGLVAFHGPMVVPNFGRVYSSMTSEGLIQATVSTEPVGPVHFKGIQMLRKGIAEGPLIGGCLSILCSLLGTPYEPEMEGAILLIEDVNEAPYRIDRMLTQLKAAGKFLGVRGIIFGRMVKCEPKVHEGYRLEDVILEVLEDVRGPILYGLPVGHGGKQVTLPLGIPVQVNGDRGSITVLESGVKKS